MLSGDKLKFLRYTHDKTQQEVADWCNVSKRYINMVECGDEIPCVKTYHAMLNCIYGIGKPLPRVKKSNAKK